MDHPRLTGLTTVAELASTWRARAETLRRYGAVGESQALEAAAAELAGALDAEENRTLPLSVAARESGYTAEHLARLIRQGKLRNCGRPGAPRVRRGDLPRKPNALPSSSSSIQLHPTSSRQVVRAIAQGDER